MKNPNIYEGKLPPRQKPRDIFEASVLIQKGELVDVHSLIQPEEKEDGYSFRSQVQKVFDHIAKIINSPEYIQFESSIDKLLKDVKEQYFIFDIEGVVMTHIDNATISQKVYYVVPWIQPIIKKLIKNGNSVGFWTSAKAEGLEKMKKAMNPGLAELPAISMDDFKKVVLAYHAKSLDKMTDEQVVAIMQSIYRTANQETFQAGLKIFNKNILEQFNTNQERFLGGAKYPQLFIPSKNGFFIDDNPLFINSAKKHGLPEHRTIKVRSQLGKNDFLNLARAIQEGMEK